jgi:hypothetical protein
MLEIDGEHPDRLLHRDTTERIIGGALRTSVSFFESVFHPCPSVAKKSTTPRRLPRAAELWKKSSCYGCGALGVGDSCACARFLSSAALAVACCRRSASDFKFGLGVDCAAASGRLSEREQAPPKKAQASKITMRILFIE